MEAIHARLEHLNFTSDRYHAAFGEIRDGVAPRRGRPRRFRADFVFGASFGGAICVARGGSAMWAWRNRSAIGCNRCGPANHCCDGGCAPVAGDRHRAEASSILAQCPPWRDRSSRHFCMASARKEQNTWPRIAASEEWKIGRVRITALVRPSRYRNPLDPRHHLARSALPRERFRSMVESECGAVAVG